MPSDVQGIFLIASGHGTYFIRPSSIPFSNRSLLASLPFTVDAPTEMTQSELVQLFQPHAQDLSGF